MVRLLIVLLSLILLPSTVFAHSAITRVNMTKNGFDPTEVTLDTNSEVVFLNVDKVDHWPASNIHPTHEIYPQFDPKRPIIPNDSWTFKPKRVGFFKFHDHLFPQNEGLLIVNGEIGNANLVNTNPPLITQMVNKISQLLNFSKPTPNPNNLEKIISVGQFRLKTTDDDPSSYIRSQMDICYQNGGRDNCYKNLSVVLFSQFDLPTLLHLLADNEQYPELFSRCHELTHYITRLSYQKEHSISKVYDQCTSVCHGGCYHGAIEEYLSEKNLSLDLTNNYQQIKNEIRKICGQKSDYKVPLLFDECLHGIGHGTMYITDGELPTALKLCDVLENDYHRGACYSGAFMENSSSSTNLDHPSKFIKSDDFLYPCDILDAKYLGICYRYQSSHFAIITQSNWKEVAKLCMQVPREYRQACFLTIGSNLVGFTQDLKTIINNCSLIEDENYQSYCYQGAVDALAIRYRNDTSRGFNFCSQLPSQFQKSCFNQYGLSITSWSNDQANLVNLCDKVANPQFASWCKGENQYLIKMTKNGFEPSDLSLEQNVVVEFKNEDDTDHWPASDVHPTHEIYPQFDPQKAVSPGQSWQFQFSKVGVWKFHDHLFPHIKGTVSVTGKSQQSQNSPVTPTNKIKELITNIMVQLKKLFMVDKKITKEDFLKLDSSKKQQQIKNMAKSSGVEKTWAFLKESFKDQAGSEGEIHDLAHFLGGLIFNDKGLSALSVCDPAFAFGCFHGFLDRAFSDSLDKLNEAQKSCEQLGQGINGPVASCIHGIGHGIASFYRTSDLNNSLKACDDLTQGAQYCYDGVFMEFSRNAVPNFYKMDDPLYPCDSLDEKFIFSCGRNLPVVLMTRFSKSFDDVVNICLGSQNQDLKNSCFDALGFNAVAKSQNNPDIISDLCGKISQQEFKTRCLKAAAGELIFQNLPNWKDHAPKLCNTLSADDKNSCLDYLQTIIKDYQR